MVLKIIALLVFIVYNYSLAFPRERALNGYIFICAHTHTNPHTIKAKVTNFIEIRTCLRVQKGGKKYKIYMYVSI